MSEPENKLVSLLKEDSPIGASVEMINISLILKFMWFIDWVEFSTLSHDSNKKKLSKNSSLVVQHSKDFFRSHSSVPFHLQMSIFFLHSSRIRHMCEICMKSRLEVVRNGGYKVTRFSVSVIHFFSMTRGLFLSTLEDSLKATKLLVFWQLKYSLSKISLEVWFKYFGFYT